MRDTDSFAASTHPDDETLADLAMGSLPGSRADTAVRHISSCPGCEERFREIASDWERSGARVGDLVLQAGSEPSAEPERKGLRERVARMFARPELRWGIPAMAAAAVLLSILPGPDAPTLIPEIHPLTSVGEGMLKRSDSTAERGAELRRGLEAYAARDWSRAAEALARGGDPGPLDVLRRLHLGSALALAGRYEEAADTFAQVSFERVPEPWSSESRWTWYVALRELGRDELAEELRRDLEGAMSEIGDRARRESTRR